MQKAILRRHAERAITAVAQYIESKNLPGSSHKWVNELLDYVISHARLNLTYPLCKNHDLAKRGLSCIVFKKKWVIAFKQTPSSFVVHQVVLGAKLK